MKTKQFRINLALPNYVIGQIVNLECDDEGTPLNDFWFRRYQDAVMDNCISPVEKSAKGSKQDGTLKS